MIEFLPGKMSKSGQQSTPLSNKFGKSANNSSQTQDWLMSVPQRVLFVEELTEIVSNRFPDLWKLGQAYFSGELHVRVEPGRQAQFKVRMLFHIMRN
jgi:exocyst complex component 2